MMADMDNHDSSQLPSVEEAKMMNASSRLGSDLGSDVETASKSDHEDGHDQLPSLEEAQFHNDGGRKKSRTMCVLALVGMVVLAIGVTLAVVLTQGGASENGEFQLSSGTSGGMKPTGGDAAGPTATENKPVVQEEEDDEPNGSLPVASYPTQPVSTTTATQAPEPRLGDLLELLETTGISTANDLNTEGSPQQLAAKWVADQDAAQVPLTDSEKVIERYIAAVFYFSAGGLSWPNRLNFLTVEGVCDWYMNGEGGEKYGLSCNDSGNVNSLVMPSKFLSGTFPQELHFLNDLERVHIFNNPGIGGKGFPQFLRGMPKIAYLGLHYCGLTGNIPSWVTEFTGLKSLVISNNNLSGEVPSEISNLKQLESLYLDDNNLEGDISVFRPLPSLTSLVIEDNRFVGTLDDSMFNNWSNLKYFDISHNRISSTIPASLFALTNLRVADLHGNKLKGSMPVVPGTNSALETLTLNDNELTGAIPSELSRCVNMKQLDLSDNKLTSSLPSSLGTMTNLEYFYAAQNSFDADPIPSFIASMTSLKQLSLKDTQRVDAIPDFFGSMTNLELLDLDSNRLTGTIPASLGNAVGLQYLLLNRNMLEGTLPSSLSSLSNLAFFLIDKNDLTGTAAGVCSNGAAVDTYVADCEANPTAEIECTCCTQCCSDGDDTCNSHVWLGDTNPIWELDFERSGPVAFDATASRTYTIKFGGAIP